MKLKHVMAFFVLLLVVLGAAFYGSLQSLKNLRNSNDYYYDTSGFAIYQGLTARQEAAENILKVSEKYQADSDGLSAQMYELERLISILRNSYQDEETAAENKKLDGIAQELVQFVKENTSITAEDIRRLDNQLAELASQQDKINRSSYHQQVEAFNVRLDSFPGNIMRALGLIEPLTDYR